MNSPSTPNVISLPGSEDGVSRSALPASLVEEDCGPEVAHASLLAEPKTETSKEPTTSAIFGPRSSGSSASVALTSSLASKLKQLLSTVGSMEYKQTWKEKTTPLGLVYWAHTASAHRANGNGFIGWLTPTATEKNHGTIKFHFDRKKAGKYEAQFRLGDQAILEFGLPMVRPSGGVAEDDIGWRLNPSHARWLMGFPNGWDYTTDTAMPSTPTPPPLSSEPPKPPELNCAGLETMEM